MDSENKSSLDATTSLRSAQVDMANHFAMFGEVTSMKLVGDECEVMFRLGISKGDVTLAAGQPSPYSDAGQPAAPDPESAGLSPQWILSQLAGMSFPQKGQAYDFMKRAIEAQRGRS